MDAAGTSEVWGRAGRWRARVAAALALTVGLAVYVLDRAPGSAYFLPQGLSLSGGQPWFGAFGGWLPEFAHVFAFSLLTALILGASRRALLASCLSWWAIDSLFEIGQHPALASTISDALPKWFARVPFLDHAGGYFIHGTFDARDLFAIAAGAVAAALTLMLLLRKESPPCAGAR